MPFTKIGKKIFLSVFFSCLVKKSALVFSHTYIMTAFENTCLAEKKLFERTHNFWIDLPPQCGKGRRR